MKNQKSLGKSPRYFSWLIIACFSVAAPNLLYAQDATTQSAGGSGGDAFTISCGSDKAMVGVQGRAGNHFLIGTFVNMVQPICVKVDAGGDWLGTPAATSSFAGVNQGVLVSLMCPSGQAVSAIGGFSGIYLDGLEVYCTGLYENGRLGNNQPRILHGNIGGIGGNFFGPYACPSAKPGKALTGRAHDWVDRIALVCNYPSTPPPTISDLSTGFTVIGGNDIRGSVSLNAPAPDGGLRITLSRQYDVADRDLLPPNPISPDPFIISAGSRYGSFTFHTMPVPRLVRMTLNGGPSPPTHVVSRTFSIFPPSMTSLSVSPRKIPTGGSATGTIVLNGNAPAGGLSPLLTSSITSVATTPPSVLIPQGTKSATFPITIAPVNRSGCSVISASGLFAEQGTDPLHQSLLTVIAPVNTAFKLGLVNSFSSSATAVLEFANVDKVTRNVTLVSSNPALVSVPASISVPAGTDSVTFTISLQSHPSTGMSCAVITATDPRGNSNSLIFSIDSAGLKANK